jgi:CheY-like chemotaxis protein
MDELPPKNAQKGRLHLLLVEDQPDTASAMQKLLEARGFSVRTAGDYRDALRIASSWMLDILISDIGLPGKGGDELLQTMRQAYPTLHAIAISGQVDATSAEQFRAAGFDEFLPKPVSIDQLSETIHRLVARQNG